MILANDSVSKTAANMMLIITANATVATSCSASCTAANVWQLFQIINILPSVLLSCHLTFKAMLSPLLLP